MYLTILIYEETPDPTEAARNLSASIAQNQSIENLDILFYGWRSSVYQTEILRGLAEYTQIRRLALSIGVQADSLSTLLSKTKSLAVLELCSVRFEETLDPIEAAQYLAACIAQNNSLELLICYNLDSLLYQSAILTGLAEQNTRIREIRLESTMVEVDVFSTFLRTVVVTTLYLTDLDFEVTPDPIVATQNLSRSIAQNSSIDFLICREVDSPYQAAIVAGLADNTRIRRFDIRAREDDEPDMGAMLVLVGGGQVKPLE